MVSNKVPTLNEFYDALETVRAIAVKTPVMESHWLSELTGQPVWRQRAMTCAQWGVVLALGVVGFFVLRRAAVFI